MTDEWVEIAPEAAKQHPLYGIGGWAALFVLSLLLLPLLAFVQVVPVNADGATGLMLRLRGQPGNSADVTSMALNLVVVVMGIGLAGMALIRSAQLPLFFRIFCFFVLLPLATFRASLGLLGDVGLAQALFAPENAALLLAGWLPWLSLSARAQVTFFNRVAYGHPLAEQEARNRAPRLLTYRRPEPEPEPTDPEPTAEPPRYSQPRAQAPASAPQPIPQPPPPPPPPPPPAPLASWIATPAAARAEPGEPRIFTAPSEPPALPERAAAIRPPAPEPDSLRQPTPAPTSPPPAPIVPQQMPARPSQAPSESAPPVMDDSVDEPGGELDFDSVTERLRHLARLIEADQARADALEPPAAPTPAAPPSAAAQPALPPEPRNPPSVATLLKTVGTIGIGVPIDDFDDTQPPPQRPAPPPPPRPSQLPPPPPPPPPPPKPAARDEDFDPLAILSEEGLLGPSRR